MMMNRIFSIHETSGARRVELLNTQLSLSKHSAQFEVRLSLASLRQRGAATGLTSVQLWSFGGGPTSKPLVSAATAVPCALSRMCGLQA